MAAETIPPAYPAPSPAGYNPHIAMLQSVSGSRVMRTGAEVRVPLFVNTGEVIEVDTRDGSYQGRVR